MKNKILNIFYHLKKKSKLSLKPLHETDITYNEKIVNDILKSGLYQLQEKKLIFLKKKFKNIPKLKISY